MKLTPERIALNIDMLIADFDQKLIDMHSIDNIQSLEYVNMSN